jgi:predicted  nucleic acid-binding Zn-ribbon protein
MTKLKDLTEAKLKDLDAMLRDKELSYADIADAYDVGKKAISDYALKRGLRRYKPRKDKGARKASTVKPVSTLRQVETELELAATQERELRKRIEELQQKRQELQIRFESDGTDVLVYGVTAQALRATSQEWLVFLNASGGTKLREFCTTAVKR